MSYRKIGITKTRDEGERDGTEEGEGRAEGEGKTQSETTAMEMEMDKTVAATEEAAAGGDSALRLRLGHNKI